MANLMKRLSDDAMVIYGKDGSTIRQIKSSLRLSVEDGTLVKMPGMSVKDEKTGAWNQLYVPSASAHMQAAQSCGLFVHHPDTVVVNDREQPNGYQDPKTDRIYFRSQCGGYTKFGQPFKTDRTVVYDVDLYNLIDLIAKASNDKTSKAFKLLPAQMPSPGETWAKYPIDESVNLWMNVADPNAIKWYKEIVNRKKNAIRTCQTFADRNAIAAHPAFPQAAKKLLTPVASVECIMWYADKGTMRFDGSAFEVDPTKLLEADGTPVETDARVIDVSEELQSGRMTTAEIDAGTASAPGEDDVTDFLNDEDDIPMGDEPDAGDREDAARAQLIKSIETQKKQKSVTFKKACIAAGVDPAGSLEECETAQLVTIEKLLASA